MEKYYYTVDFSKVKIYSEVHEVLMRDLDFPDYYGCNLDALYDCFDITLIYEDGRREKVK